MNPIELQRLPKNYLLTSDSFYIIDTFSNVLGTVRGTIDPNVTGKISQVRIHIPNSSETWIIISEIDLSTPSPVTRVNSELHSTPLRSSLT